MSQHEFDPGYSGVSTKCNQLVLDEGGYGIDCGRLVNDPVHFQRDAECVGCLTGYDIGLPSSQVAYAHPECPVHSDTEQVPLSPEQEETIDARCWCGGEVGPREPGDADGLGCLVDIWHDWYQFRPQDGDKVDAMTQAVQGLSGLVGGVPEKVCRTCGMSGGPYPNGDRPKPTAPLYSGCPRCGFCY